jgi:predicted dehydrogenase
MRQFRIGILGCGYISNTYIADIQSFYKNLKIAACADLVPEIAMAQADKYGIARSCTPE